MTITDSYSVKRALILISLFVGNLLEPVRCCMPDAFLVWISPGVQTLSSRYSSRAR